MSFKAIRRSKRSLALVAGTGLLFFAVAVAARASLSLHVPERLERSPFHPQWLVAEDYSLGVHDLLESSRPTSLHETVSPVYPHVEITRTQLRDPSVWDREAHVVLVAGEDPDEFFDDVFDAEVLEEIMLAAAPVDLDSDENKVVCCEVAFVCEVYTWSKCPEGTTQVPCPCPPI